MLNPSLKDLNLSFKQLKKIVRLLAKERGINAYESMSKDELLSVLKASESKNNTRTEKTKYYLRNSNKKFLNQK